MIEIDGRRVRFFPPAGAAFLAGDFTDWDESPIAISGTVELEFPPDSYVEYGFLSASGEPLADAENPKAPLHPWYPWHRCFRIGQDVFVAPPEVDRPAGSLRQHTLRSSVLNGERSVTCYEPPVSPAASLFVFDGDKYLANLRLHHVCEALWRGGRIEPVRTVYLHAHRREVEYRFSEAHEKYLVHEVMPMIDREYGSTATVALWGASLGGLTAAWNALRNPRLFPKIAMQSACLTASPGGMSNYHDPEYLTLEYAGNPPPLTGIYMDTGMIEWLHGPNQRFAEMLAKAQIPHCCNEWPGGHNWHTWRAGLVPGLTWLFGRSS